MNITDVKSLSLTFDNDSSKTPQKFFISDSGFCSGFERVYVLESRTGIDQKVLREKIARILGRSVFRL